MRLVNPTELIAERLNVRICTENMWQYDSLRGCIVPSVCADPKEFCALIDAVDSPYLAACLDVGHCALTGYDIPAFIRTLGKDRLKALHIHDNDGRDDLHLAPMTGVINWAVLCDCLKQIGFDGDLSFETFLQVRIAQRFDDELLMPWLKLICATGESFRNKIQN